MQTVTSLALIMKTLHTLPIVEKPISKMTKTLVNSNGHDQISSPSSSASPFSSRRTKRRTSLGPSATSILMREVEVEDNDGEDISCSGAAEDNDDDDVMSIRLADAKPCASTLVVVPDVLVQQWSEQIARHVNLRVLGPYYIDRYCKKRFVPLPPAQYLSTCSIIVVSFSYVLLHVHHVHAQSSSSS